MRNEHMKQYPPRPMVSVGELAHLIATDSHAQKYDWADRGVARSIAETFFSTGHGDGFEIVMHMGAYSDFSRDEMEDLDCVGVIHDALLKDKGKAWALSNAVEPPFPVSTKVFLIMPLILNQA